MPVCFWPFQPDANNLIRQRQAEGIAIAKANGVKFGVKPKEMPVEFEAVCEQCLSGELSTRKAAQKLGLAYSTFYRNYKKYQNNASKSRQLQALYSN